METYAQKLRDPRWQKRRLEVLERDGWKCSDCGDADSELHVHHVRYRTGANPWDYEDSDLRTLCSDCHGSVTQLTRAARAIVYDMLSEDAELTYQLIDAAQGLLIFSGEASELVVQMSHDLARAAMNGAGYESFISPFIRCRDEIRAIAQETERGKD